MENMDRREKWRIDTTISLPNVISLIMTIGAFIWWAAHFSASTEFKFQADDKRMTAIESRQNQLDKVPERLATQEAKLEAVLGGIQEIRDELRENRKSDVSLRRLELKSGLVRE